MKIGDLVRYKSAHGILGLFLGLRTSGDYEYAEVMWFGRPSPSGGPVSSCQKNLLEVINESR